MSKKSENPAGRKPTKVVVAPEAKIAQSANALGVAYTKKSFGAPVSTQQVALYQRAMKRAKLTKAHFVGAPKNVASAKQLLEVAQGKTRANALPEKTKASFAKLSDALDVEHKKDGKVNKTWPRKHAIVLCAIFEAKPARPARPKAEPKVETPQVETTQVAA